MICDRDSWVLLWNELNKSEEQRDQCLGLAISRFLYHITFEQSPVLFLTPIALSPFELKWASIGLNIESFEIFLPINNSKNHVHFFYKYPCYGWRKQRKREKADLNRPWIELAISSKNEIEKFRQFYQVVSKRDWRIIVGQWYWSIPILIGLFRSLFLDFRYRWKINKECL